MKGQLHPFDLKVNHVENPLGLGREPLFFNWKTESFRRGAKQTACRILVASASALLSEGEGDLWDSGRMETDDSIQVAYRGKETVSGGRYCWKVMLWDEKGEPSGWSAPAFFEMGLNGEGDWKGGWISGREREEDLRGGQWIGCPDETAERIQFYRRLELPEGAIVRQAWFGGTADSQIALFINGSTVARSNYTWGQRYIDPFCWVDFAEKLRAGENVVCCDVSRKGGGGAFIGKFRVLLADGTKIAFGTDDDWECAANPGFEPKKDGVRLISAGKAKVRGRFGDAPWGKFSRRGCAPLFRKEFELPKKIKKARLYVCGLGYCAVTLNGKRPDGNLLEPAYTQYDKRVYYVTKNVGSLLREGRNCIGAALGRGYYACGRDWIGKGDWLDEPKMLLQLAVTYEDGTEETVVSDESWKTADAPTFDDSVWYGEKYDANKEQPGWDLPGFADDGWSAARRAAPPLGKLETKRMPPVRVTEKIDCVLSGRPKEGVFVYDAGRVMAGACRVTLRGPKNARVRISYAERLTQSGRIDTWKDGQDGQFWETPQVDFYICRGGGEESWEPRFSYKGFRYIEIEGDCEPLAAQALVFHNAVENAGDFSCGNGLFNRIHAMVRNSILSNLHTIPSDTPMHEKRGWTGDAQTICDTAACNFDMHDFFEKWVQDIADSQNEEGAVSHTCPGPTAYPPTPAWMSALLIIPWSLYRNYGDREILRRYYPVFRKYGNYELNRLVDGVSSDAHYADWHCPEGARGPEGATLFATAYVYRACDLLARMAAVLGFAEDEKTFRAAAEKLRAKINTAFFDREAGVYHTEIEAGYRQSSNVLPLAFGIVPEEFRRKVADNLSRDVLVTRGGHLDTGCFSTKYLAPLLSEYGHYDAAYALADARTFPGWGYWLENGATGCLEGWKLDVRSLNHHYLGTIDEWFYGYVLGIRALEPGWKKIRVRPYPGALRWAKGGMETVRGTVSVRWEKEGGRFRLWVRIPANAEALVDLPGGCAAVTESGAPAESAEGLMPLGEQDGFLRFAAGSGSYYFDAALAEETGV